MYNNPYLNNYNPQANIDRINNQIAELEKLRSQIPMQSVQPITQNFQISPSNKEGIRYANNMDEVLRDMVAVDTPYFSKDMSVVWIKNSKGEIKTYELEEVIPKDSKDLKIEYLEAQIKELKKGMKKYEPDASINDTITESVENEKSSNVSTSAKSTKKSK